MRPWYNPTSRSAVYIGARNHRGAALGHHDRASCMALVPGGAGDAGAAGGDAIGKTSLLLGEDPAVGYVQITVILLRGVGSLAIGLFI